MAWIGDDADELVSALGRGLADVDRVSAALLFGSHARGKARPDSDIDVAVLLDPPPGEGEGYPVAREVMLALSRVVAGERLDLVLLHRAPPSLAFRILRDGRVVYCSDPVALHRFRVRIYDLHADFAPVDALFQRSVRRRALAAVKHG